LFEILDAGGTDSISFREFCALVYLVAGVQSNQLLQCLYEHGVLLFDIIGGGQHFVSGERAKVLARAIGISERVIDSTAEEVFGITQNSIVDFDDF
jgi:hypothetical protein